MSSLQEFIDSQLTRGRAYFSKAAALAEVRQTPQAFKAAVARLTKKGRLVSPRRGFYLILRPEDRLLGAPDPVSMDRPIDEASGAGLSGFLAACRRFPRLGSPSGDGLSGHYAAGSFRQSKSGGNESSFIYQAPAAFTETNRPEWLAQLKTEAGLPKSRAWN